MEGKACGLGQVTPRKPTRPKSPGRGLADPRKLPAEPPAPEFAAFRARPMPTFSPSLVSPRPQSTWLALTLTLTLTLTLILTLTLTLTLTR